MQMECIIRFLNKGKITQQSSKNTLTKMDTSQDVLFIVGVLNDIMQHFLGKMFLKLMKYGKKHYSLSEQNVMVVLRQPHNRAHITIKKEPDASSSFKVLSEDAHRNS